MNFDFSVIWIIRFKIKDALKDIIDHCNNILNSLFILFISEHFLQFFYNILQKFIFSFVVHFYLKSLFY